MATSIHSMIPDAAAVLALDPEELAGVLMEHLHSLPLNEKWSLNRYSLLYDANRCFAEYPTDRREQVRDAFIEAWSWLENQTLLVPRSADSSGQSFTFSRRGRQMTSRADVVAYRGQNVLRREQLHPRIAHDVWGLFIRGKYDTAVFEAFKEVEVSVREAAGLADADLGVTLVRKAFDENSGPLRDQSLVVGERQAMAHLFAGAIGVFKNPQSHRHVALKDPHEAMEMLMLANYLLRIVDTAVAGTNRGDNRSSAGGGVDDDTKTS